MENESILVLQEIRGALYVIAGVLVIWFAVWVITPASVLRAIYKSVIIRNWKDEAIELWESGNFKKLISHCQDREKTHKFDPSSYYWRARVHIKNGEPDEAHEYFMYIREISPDWFDEYVKPHYYSNDKRSF